MRRFVTLAACAVSITLAGLLAPALRGTETTDSESYSLDAVETDLHEFMEYYNQPAFRRLKAAMSVESDEHPWSEIKSNALLLAEAGNLLFLRGPEEDRQDWLRHAATARQAGGELYGAAKQKDFDRAEQHYRSLIKNCNQCHDQFAGGDPQLQH